jgi:arylsulfatase
MTPKPLGSGEWELFNIAQDPGEQNNRATDKPRVMQDMLQEWARYEKENGLVYADSSPI